MMTVNHEMVELERMSDFRSWITEISLYLEIVHNSIRQQDMHARAYQFKVQPLNYYSVSVHGLPL